VRQEGRATWRDVFSVHWHALVCLRKYPESVVWTSGRLEAVIVVVVSLLFPYEYTSKDPAHLARLEKS
jgi:hypothetical protein